MCEKPLCITMEHAIDIKYQLEQRNYNKGDPDSKIFWVGMEYRFMPAVKKMIEEKERLSRLCMLSIREHRFPFLKKVNNWNRFNANTGGTLVEKCCHFFDLMNCIYSDARPVRVYASGSQACNHKRERTRSGDVGTGVHEGTPDILDNAYVIVDFSNSARAALDLCMFAEASRFQEELCLVGEQGKIEAFCGAHGESTMKDEPNFFIGVKQQKREEMDVVDLQKTEKPPPPETVESMQLTVPQEVLDAGYHEGATYFEVEAFWTAVKNSDVGGVVNAQDGLMAVAVGLAAQKSIEEGRAVLISEMLSLD